MIFFDFLDFFQDFFSRFSRFLGFLGFFFEIFEIFSRIFKNLLEKCDKDFFELFAPRLEQQECKVLYQKFLPKIENKLKSVRSYPTRPAAYRTMSLINSIFYVDHSGFMFAEPPTLGVS